MTVPAAEEAWRQARQHAAWMLDVPKTGDPGDPPPIAREAAQAMLLVGPERLLEGPDDVPPQRWHEAYQQVVAREPSMEQRIADLEARIAALERAQP
ncbi:MAG: hypothetical protein M3O70_12345 [Actinomycetota bacterium]|nr:hypothetical protein [Actinomycetota bacterium]